MWRGAVEGICDPEHHWTTWQQSRDIHFLRFLKNQRRMIILECGVTGRGSRLDRFPSAALIKFTQTVCHFQINLTYTIQYLAVFFIQPLFNEDSPSETKNLFSQETRPTTPDKSLHFIRNDTFKQKAGERESDKQLFVPRNKNSETLW